MGILNCKTQDIPATTRRLWLHTRDDQVPDINGLQKNVHYIRTYAQEWEQCEKLSLMGENLGVLQEQRLTLLIQ